MYPYRDNPEYRDAQLKRQSAKIICSCGTILLYSSLSPHKLSSKHFRLQLRADNPDEYNKLVRELHDIRKNKMNKKTKEKIVREVNKKFKTKIEVKKKEVKKKEIKNISFVLNLEFPVN